MKNTIWKFPFVIEDVVTVSMPEDATVLSVQVQNGEPCIWAVVDPSNPIVMRIFHLRGTGHALGEVGQFIGTFQMMDGGLVFHLFDGDEL